MVETFGTSEIDPDKLPGTGARASSTSGRPRSSSASTCGARSTGNTAAYGHFGRSDPDFTWERTDRAEELKKAAEAIA